MSVMIWSGISTRNGEEKESKMTKNGQKIYHNDNTHTQTSQHIKDTCCMKLEVLQMWGKAALESHETITLRDMIQKVWDTINHLLSIIHELKDYINVLGQVKVLRERLHL